MYGFRLPFGHHPGTPVRGVGRLAVQGGFANRGALSLTDQRDAARTGSSLLQTGGAQRQKPLPPQLHGGPRDAHLASDVPALDSLGRQQDDPGPSHKARGLSSGSGPPLQSAPLLVRKQNGCDSSAHGRHDT